MELTYQQKLLQIKNGSRPKETGPKKKKPLRRESEKSAAKRISEKIAMSGDESEHQIWFNERRPELTGICQCGCGQKSSKHDDKNFRSSICHIFPQRLFKSIELHPENFVERNFWDGCHSNMDNRSMDLWPNFADWDVIKAKFKILEPLLTEKEKSKKFYTKLGCLASEN